MNQVILSGRITSDVELRKTPQGKSVCTFNIAVDRATSNNDADFPTIVAWEKTAEFVTNYLSKGRKIMVKGELRTRMCQDKDTGKNRKITEVYADRIEFADSRLKEVFSETPQGYNNSAEYSSSFSGNTGY